MDREHVLRLLDRERRSLAYARTSIDVQPALTRARAADGSHHTIIFSSLPAADAEAIIDRELSTIAGAACLRVEERDVAHRIFGKDYSFTADELAAALATGSTQHRAYIACAGDEPVSIGRLYTHPDSAFGALYGGGTLSSHRGRGFYRALVAARGRDAIAAGARYLLVGALPTSLAILRRLGFEWLTDTWPCRWQP
jgi:hypothetical protein